MEKDTKELKDFIDDVFKKFKEEITDRIFLFIQEDSQEEGLLQRYLDIISTYGREETNRAIGRDVNAHFNLENKEDRNGNKIKGLPKSFLIKIEYTKHKRK